MGTKGSVIAATCAPSSWSRYTARESRRATTTADAGRSASGSASRSGLAIPPAAGTCPPHAVNVAKAARTSSRSNGRAIKGAPRLRRRIRSEKLEEGCQTLHLLERRDDRAIREVSRHLDVEEVRPWFPLDGVAKDVGQVDAPLCEHAEH